MKHLKSLIFVLYLCLSGYSWADSPLTTTSFGKRYQSLSIIKEANNMNGALSSEMMDYLSDANNPIDVKMNIVNVMSWSRSDKYETYMNYLKNKYTIDNEEEVLDTIDASVHISLAYLKAMDNYFDVNDAYIMACNALKKDEKSETIRIVIALMRGQMALDENDWCDVYKAMEEVLTDTTLTHDIHPSCINSIMEYIGLYKEYCNK